MAEQDLVPPPGPEGPGDLREFVHALAKRHLDANGRPTEAMLELLRPELEKRVGIASELFRQGLEAADTEGREDESRRLFTRAGQWTEHIPGIVQWNARERFAVLGIEAALISGHSALRAGDLLRAQFELGWAREAMLASLPAGDDLFLKVPAVEADLRTVRVDLVAQSSQAPAATRALMLEAAADIEATLPGTDPQRLQDLRLRLLSSQIEAMETADDPVRAGDHRTSAVNTSLSLLSAQPLDETDSGLRPTAYTYARLLRETLAAGTPFRGSELSAAVGNLRAVVDYLEAGDRGEAPGMDTREALLALREFSRAHADGLRPGGPGWDGRPMTEKREAIEVRLELLAHAADAGMKESPHDEARKAGDLFDLFSAVTGADPSHWVLAAERFGDLPDRLAGNFGPDDARVGQAAVYLAAMEFRQGETDLAAGRPGAALPAIKRAIGHQERALENFRARGTDTTETRERLDAMRRAQGRASTESAGVRPASTLQDALLAKRKAAGRITAPDIATAVASRSGPAPRSDQATRDARSAIRRARRGR
jgi:hypothetical protein